MKTFIICAFLFSALCAVVVSTLTEEEMLEFANSCMTEFKVSEKQMNDTQSGVIKPADVPETVKCSLKCFLEKMEVMDSITFEIVHENVKEKYPEIPKPAMDKCLALKGKNPCDTAYKVVDCFWKADAI